MSYDGARVLEASGRPMLVIGRSYWVVPIQEEDVNAEAGTKLAEETTENSETAGTGVTGIQAETELITAGTGTELITGEITAGTGTELITGEIICRW